MQTFLVRSLTAAFAIAVFALSGAASAQRGIVATTCANTTSGAQWQIKIDYDRNTVDSFPARITENTISWRDTRDGGNNTLDRKSGGLTFVVASSTGGAFFYARCKLEN